MALFLLNHSSPSLFLIITTTLYFLSSLPIIINSLSTIAISEATYSNQTFICALQPPNNQEEGQQSNLNCTTFPSTAVAAAHNITTGLQLLLNPNISYSQIVAGNGFLCALRPPSSSTSIMGCWRFSANATTNNNNVPYKRIYRGPVIETIDAGNSHVCGLVNGDLECWQWPGFNSSQAIISNMYSIAVGLNFVCGLSSATGNIACSGNNNTTRGGVVDHEPPSGNNYTVIEAGFGHACAISIDGSLDCWGEMDMMGGNEKNPQGRFISLALGENRSCALRENGTVACWGSNNFSMPQRLQTTSFQAIVAKRRVFCGVVSYNYSLLCWGTEFFDESNSKVFDVVLPGPCRNKNQCPCGPLSDSSKLCGSPSIICKPCPPVIESPLQPPPSPGPGPGPTPPPYNTKSGWSKKMVAFLVVGCVGCSSLLLVLAYFLYIRCKCRGCRVHDSGRLDESGSSPREPQPEADDEAVTAVLEKRLSHIISMGNGSHLEEYSLQVLLEATNNFSEEKKIGIGSFGSVYHATLEEDGKEVAIKRAEFSSTSPSHAVLGATKRQEDKDNAFVNELESLSRLHHKNLVQLLGFYEDRKERILVYEYMNNGSLNDHLHNKKQYNMLQSSAGLVSWPGRIKVALDAARGIEYLHQYATPPIIHRDIKSSNILLDAKWTAKVSDFGLSLMGPEDEDSHLSLLAAGTVGYIDPEYYRLQHLTTKSDVYSFGVVLLEMLSGQKAIHKNENGVPRNVVDFMVPYIVQDEIHRVLDPRVPPPTPYEIEGVAFVGYLAADCVSLEGRNRPTMSQVVNSLETALAACLAQPTTLSSTTASSH